MHLQPKDRGPVKGDSGSLLACWLAGPDSRSTGALSSRIPKKDAFFLPFLWGRKQQEEHIMPASDRQAVHKYPQQAGTSRLLCNEARGLS